MKTKGYLSILSILMLGLSSVFGQNVSLYNQFNGRFDFTFIGNTMNPEENSFMSTPTILTSSSANLNLSSNDIVEKAYLYWAGCGTGDFNVKLNNIDIVAERTFSNILLNQYHYFSAFKDITSIITSTGNGTYTLSDLDVSSFINFHSQNSTNFAGWAIIIVYKNITLPLNQINVYDGLQVVSQQQNSLSINLNSLNVIDNVGAKIGFLAWEGDSGIAVNETLRINNTILSNPPLNPANNAFNGTNSITGSAALYNMDLDIYNIQNNINPGDSSAIIEMTSSQDYVMINAIVTKLNSQVPDATTVINSIQQECNSRNITIDFNVNNFNSTNFLPVNNPVSIYANNTLVSNIFTTQEIPIDGTWNSQVSITIPNNIPNDFILKIVADDTGNGNGIVNEINETNNGFTIPISLWVSPLFNVLPDLKSCNLGFTKAIFDFSEYEYTVKQNPNDNVTFYPTLIDAENETNEIINTTNYTSETTPKEIFIRLENEHCYSITSFLLKSRNCPPIIYNYVSGNGDQYNNSFFIEGLRNIFTNFHIELYNRWGRLIWTGNNSSFDWNGFASIGFRFDNNNSPKGTYYYILYLNDEDYTEPFVGWIYFTR